MLSRHIIYSGAFLQLLNFGRVSANRYRLKDAFMGQDFFNTWTWETFQDPTHGRVNYVDQETAMTRNLSYVIDDRFYMRADSSSFVAAASRGRDSIRIKSNAAYDASLMVLDLSHMPEGCATWPAWWTLSAKGPWPIGGEIDIIEGVNLNSRNAATLHTAAGCSMNTNEPRIQKGTATSDNCDVAANSNQGCGTRFSSDNSYGANFNRQGGGWYAIQRDPVKGIDVWFWARGDPSLPRTIQYGSSDLAVDNDWGIPEASFKYANCEYGSHFDAHEILFDLTFCGDWAGSAFMESGCGITTCDDFVDHNPERFKEAYWEINSLRVYIPEDHGVGHHMHPFELARPITVLDKE